MGADGGDPTESVGGGPVLCADCGPEVLRVSINVCHDKDEFVFGAGGVFRSSVICSLALFGIVNSGIGDSETLEVCECPCLGFLGRGVGSKIKST